MFKPTKRIFLNGVLLWLAAVGLTAVIAAEPANLIYRTDSEMTFEVTSNGLARITFQGRPLAAGEWSAFNAGGVVFPWRQQRAGAGSAIPGAGVGSSFPEHAVVRQRKDDLLCVFDHTFAGEAQSTHRLKAELKKYMSPSIVCIDELGYLPIDKIGADLLFQVFSQRYETGSTIVTTNQPYKNWPKIFNNDSTLTSAVLDRLLHHAETVIVEGRSYRMKDQIETP